MTSQEVVAVADSTRADILVSLILDAVAEKRHPDAVAHARRLGDAWPEVRDWCSWVVAGCLALEGDVPKAREELHRIADDGGWLAPSLLDDGSLEPLWDEPGGARLRAALTGSPVSSPAGPPVEVLVTARPRVVAVTVHGNGPLPLGAQREMWRAVPGTSVYAVRSPYLVAPGTPVWADRRQAREQVCAAVGEVRDRVPGVPVVLVGLGSGATISLEVAASGVSGLAHVVAFAPRTPRVVGDREARTPPSTVAVDASDAETSGIRQWGDSGDHSVRIDGIEALGHAFPADLPGYVTTVEPWRTTR